MPEVSTILRDRVLIRGRHAYNEVPLGEGGSEYPTGIAFNFSP